MEVFKSTKKHLIFMDGFMAYRICDDLYLFDNKLIDNKYFQFRPNT